MSPPLPHLGFAVLLLAGCQRHAPTPVVPSTALEDTRTRPVTTAETLKAFARLYGYVRFFHPTDAAAGADWQALAAQGAAFVVPAGTVGELRARLVHVFRPFAPTLALWIDPEAAPPLPEALRRIDAPVYWQYQGFPGTPMGVYRPPYRARRVGRDRARAFSEVQDFGATLSTELAAGLHVQLALILPERSVRAGDHHDPTGLSPAVGKYAHRRDGYRSLHVRRGAVIEVWNVLRHFYPYQDVVDANWNDLLGHALADTEDDVTLADVRTTLRGLVRAVHDGHGRVGHPTLQRAAVLPFRIELIAGQAVVTATRDNRQFSIGDIVETIDGQAVAPRIRQLAAELSGSPQWRALRASGWEATRGPRGQAVDVALRNTRGQRVERVRYAHDDPPSPPHPDAITRFDDGVYYVDLTQSQWDDIEPHLGDLATAPAVVFDMRGYPGHVDRIVDHLLRAPEDAKWMHIARIMEPDGQVATWHDIGWHRRPSEPTIAGTVAFLVSAEAISYAESILGYVDSHDLGILIGSTSAGANGDVVRLDTLSHFYVVFTGMRVTRHDGRPFHTRGVSPDIVVERTIAALRAGRDEALETALAEVRARIETTVQKPTDRPLR